MHSVQENENENVDGIALRTMREKLDIVIEENDLDGTHSIGSTNRKDGKPEVAIVKLARCAFQNKIFSRKKKNSNN